MQDLSLQLASENIREAEYSWLAYKPVVVEVGRYVVMIELDRKAEFGQHLKCALRQHRPGGVVDIDAIGVGTLATAREIALAYIDRAMSMSPELARD